MPGNNADAVACERFRGIGDGIMLNRYVITLWVAAATGSEGPLDVVLKLLRAIREIIELIRSL